MSLLFESVEIKNKTLKVIRNMIVDEESAKELFNLVLSVFNESTDETTIICQNILKKINHFSNTS